MTKNTFSGVFNNKQKRYWKQIISMAVQAALANPGSTPTEHFKKIDLLVRKVNQKHPINDNQKFAYEVVIGRLISTTLKKKMKFKPGLFQRMHLEDAIRSIANYSGDIVECRNVIKYQTGLSSVEELHCVAMIVSKWIALDLLAYSWNNGCPYCPDILGTLVAAVHRNGGIDGGCAEHFGIQTTIEMFEAASPEGLRYISATLEDLDKPIKAYRACIYSTGTEAASGITWTPDYSKALGWASNHFVKGKIFPIISSTIHPKEILTSFEIDKELIVYPQLWRKFSVINPKSDSTSATGLLENV